MFGLEYLIYTGLSVTFGPIFILLSVIIVMAAFGKSSGITRFYTNILILVFEWGKYRIELFENTKYENNKETKEEEIGRGDENKEMSVESRRTLSINYDGRISGFHLADIMNFCQKGIKVIVEDAVTQRFDAAELSSWNLLTRTNTHYEFISCRLTLLWGIGCILRLCILFPLRLIIIVVATFYLVIGTTLIGNLPDGKFKQKTNYWLNVTVCRLMSRSFSSVITFHNKHNKASGGGICVANHTSPIDIIVLGNDNCYAMVGQSQGGLFGFFQRTLSRSEHHIWFQRSEVKDRLAVTRRLKVHVDDSSKLPILIFPEGTCINNTSIMMFKKGSFEVGGTIYPAAIKYDSRFSDPFWNSSKHSLSRHFLNLLTSWALVCDVWYLPPQTIRPGETAIQFTSRVKTMIAEQGGLVDLEWDGQLKREKPKPALMLKQQLEFSKRICMD